MTIGNRLNFEVGTAEHGRRMVHALRNHCDQRGLEFVSSYQRTRYVYTIAGLRADQVLAVATHAEVAPIRVYPTIEIALDPMPARRTRHVTGVRVHEDSVDRGGSTRNAECVCGWCGPERGTMELAADDAVAHESEEQHTSP